MKLVVQRLLVRVRRVFEEVTRSNMPEMYSIWLVRVMKGH